MMEDNLLNKDLFKSYSKYCLPVLFLIIVILVALLLGFNNITTNLISYSSITDAQQISDIRYEFIGEQLLNFNTFILSCVLPIVIALLMGTYSKNNKVTATIKNHQIFSTNIMTGTLYIVLPFLANVISYIILLWSGFFGYHQSDALTHLLLMTVFGIALSMLTFILISMINIALKNPIIDSLLTLAIAVFVIHVFYSLPINPIFLIFIIFFVWLALLYLSYTLTTKKKSNE